MVQRRALLWPAGVVATILLLFGAALGPGRTLAFRDTDRLYAPVRSLVDESLRSGRLPLWNPYECLGKPLFGEGIHGVLHPASIAAAWVAPGSVDFLAVAYLLAAALGALAVARTLGASPAAAAAAGLAYGLSGYVLCMTGNLVFLAGAASVPWVVAAGRAAGDGARLGPFAVALATAIAFLSGDTQAAAIGICLGVALAWASGGARGAGRALLGVAAGVLLAGVQILATRGVLAQASRGAGLEPWEREQWPLEPGRIVEWIVPGLVNGELGALSHIPAILGSPKLRGQFAESVYLGAPVLVLAAVGLSATRAERERRRTALVLAAAIAVLLWIALGHLLGARQLLDYVPIWNRFRYAEKMMGPIALCASAAAALGLDRAARARLPRGAVLGAAAAGLLCGLALGAVVVAPGVVRGLAGGLSEEAAAFLTENLRRGLVHPILALAALLAVDRLATEALRPALLALTTAVTVAAAASYGAHLGVQRVHELASPFRLDADAPGARLAHPLGALLSPTADLDAIDVNAMLARTTLVPAVNVERRVDHVDCYGALSSSRRALFGETRGPWMIRNVRRYGLTHVVLTPPADDAEEAYAAASVAGGHVVESLADPEIAVWAVPHRRWVFFAREAVSARDARAARAVVEDLTKKGDDDLVVVEAPAAPATAPGRVLSIARGLEEVRIEAEATGPALLVVNDAYWPGWRAFVDGAPAEILPADALVRAIRWPPGRHTLAMRYEPAEVRVGLALSAVGALVTLALAAYPLAASRRRRDGPATSSPETP